MATLTGTTIDASTENRTDPSIPHTVQPGTTLLLVTAGTRQDFTLNGITWNGSEPLTEIRTTQSTSVSANMAVRTYGLVNPTATTANIDIDYSAAMNMDWAVINNWTDTVASSVAAATNYHNESETVAPDNSTTTVLTSAGTPGNIVYVGAALAGADGVPASESPPFTDIANQNTGGGSGTASDASFYVGYVDAPSGCTITWQANDQESGHLLELVTAPSTKTASARLADIDGVDRANLTGLTYSWFDAPPATGVSPTDTGVTTTDASGNLSVTLDNTTLNVGQTGYLLVVDTTNNWQGIYAVVVS